VLHAHLIHLDLTFPRWSVQIVRFFSTHPAVSSSILSPNVALRILCSLKLSQLPSYKMWSRVVWQRAPSTKAYCLHCLSWRQRNRVPHLKRLHPYTRTHGVTPHKNVILTLTGVRKSNLNPSIYVTEAICLKIITRPNARLNWFGLVSLTHTDIRAWTFWAGEPKFQSVHGGFL
jgi:hypothetical protein